MDALHDEYEFVRHQTGTTMGKTKMSEMMASMMANEDVVIKDPRCIYENDEILVEHSVIYKYSKEDLHCIELLKLKDKNQDICVFQHMY